MDVQTTGTVISVKEQWWFQVNTKPVRSHSLDGAVFPSVIKVKYTVHGREYIKAKWIHAGRFVPSVGSTVRVDYRSDRPKKSCITI